MAIALNNNPGDITPENEQLLGRTPDGVNVIQRVNRNPPKWRGVSINSTLQPEVIYKINSGVTELRFQAQGGLYQMLNASDRNVSIIADFSDNTTFFTLEPGVFLQSEGFMTDDGYKYTKLSALFGTGAGAIANPTEPPSADSYIPPNSLTNIGGGEYKLAPGQIYVQKAPADITILPSVWLYWVDAVTGVATVKLNASTDNIPVFFKSTAGWLSSSTNPDIHINAGEAVKIVLRNITPAERSQAVSKTGASGDVNLIYEIETIWKKSPDLPTIKNSFGANSAPTITNDISEGYSNGSIWNWGDRVWVLVDSSDNTARWVELTDSPTPVVGAEPNAYNIFNPITLTSRSSVPPGVWVINSGEVWTYGDTPAGKELPFRWIFWNRSDTGIASLVVALANGQTINFNATTNRGGPAIADGEITVAAGEIWEIEVRNLTNEEKTLYGALYNIIPLPISIRYAKKISSNISTVLNGFGDWSVIRIAQDIDTGGFEPLKLYLLDNLAIGDYKLIAKGRILNNKGIDYVGLGAVTVDGKDYKTLTLPKTRSQYFAYRVGDNLVIWALETSGGIFTGDVFPTNPDVKIFHLLGHPTFIDGIYCKDRLGNWVK